MEGLKESESEPKEKTVLGEIGKSDSDKENDDTRLVRRKKRLEKKRVKQQKIEDLEDKIAELTKSDMMINVGKQHGHVLQSNKVEIKGDMAKNVDLTAKVKKEGRVSDALLRKQMIDDVRNVLDVTKKVKEDGKKRRRRRVVETESDDTGSSSSSFDSSSSESSSESDDSSSRERKNGKKGKKKKRKSGIADKAISSKIRRKCKWSHILLNKTLLGGKELKFVDLSFTQLVAGELEILTRCKMSKEERKAVKVAYA